MKEKGGPFFSLFACSRPGKDVCVCSGGHADEGFARYSSVTTHDGVKNKAGVSKQ